MKPRFLLLIPALLLGVPCVSGQSENPDPLSRPGGIDVRYGASYFSMRDAYISPERYEGYLPGYALGWTRTHNTYVYRLDFSFSYSDDIENNSVRSEVLTFRLSQGFLYPLKALTLFKKDLGLWIGPSADISYFANDPDIAVSGFDYTNSFATLISLGFRGEGIYPLSGKIAIEPALQFTMLSLGLRSVDSEEDDEPGAKFLSPASGLNAAFELGLHYDPLPWLSVGLAYRFELLRITAWDDLLADSNGAIIALRFNF
jgi:hypothetical protein